MNTSIAIKTKLSRVLTPGHPFLVAVAVALSGVSAVASTPGAPWLASYNIDASQITISGVSSGGFMAVQFHLAHSSLIGGAASVAGGMYWCAQGSSTKAQTECMQQPGRLDVNASISEAQRLAARGDIDPLSETLNDAVYLYASPKDAIINPVNTEKLRDFYIGVGLPQSGPSARLVTDITGDAAHGFPTLSYGAPCKIGFSPWLLNCGVDLAGQILARLHPTVALQAKGSSVDSSLFAYDQTEFGDASTPLFANGWIYAPEACRKGASCRLHIALHGCQMNPDFIQDQFARHAGYNDWAESNQMVILYPQSAKLAAKNPYACWDWFGFTGSEYATKSAPQIRALKGMIDRVRGLR